MGIVDRINSNLESLYNTDDPIYQSFIANKNGTIPSIISKPTDIDIGAIASQIEYLRMLSICLVRQLFLDEASGDFLKYQLNDFFNSLKLEDETDIEWVQRTIATIFSQKVSRATIINALMPYSSQEPIISNIIQESAFADFSFADIYIAGKVTEIETTIRDYTQWEELIQPNTNARYAIAYGEGIFVAVSWAGSNRITRSTDNGETWSQINAPEDNSWLSIAYGDGVFISLANNGTNRIMRSEDLGLTWDLVVAPENNKWLSIAYGDGVFVGVSQDGTNRIMRSEDLGLTWTAVTAPQANRWFSITFGNGTFVAVSLDGTNRSMYSDDLGVTWNLSTPPTSADWYAIAYGEGVFVAIALSGTNKTMRSIDNGRTWNQISANPDANPWRAIAYGGGYFIAVSSAFSDRVMYSKDLGLSWHASLASPDTSGWYGIAFGNNFFVATAVDGKIMRNFYEEILTPTLIYILPAIAENYQSSYFTIKITLFDTANEDIWTIQNILDKIIAAGISYILIIQYT